VVSIFTGLPDRNSSQNVCSKSRPPLQEGRGFSDRATIFSVSKIVDICLETFSPTVFWKCSFMILMQRNWLPTGDDGEYHALCKWRSHQRLTPCTALGVCSDSLFLPALNTTVDFLSNNVVCNLLMQGLKNHYY